jgi:arylsulfatase A-like enzyme
MSPNIVLFISDQQRADTMPGMRSGAAYTPHLDWLAERGTLFRRAYCTVPMCSPARASLLSGQYPHAHGMIANHQERPVSRDMHLSPRVDLLADYLNPQGFDCAYTGKWHLGTGSDRRGFKAFATRSGDHEVDHPSDNEILQFTRKAGIAIGGKLRGLDVDPDRYESGTKVGSSALPLAFHTSARDARAAARFVHSRKGNPNPFCLVTSCHEPHPPFVSPRPFDALISPSEVTLPRHPNDPAAAGLMAGRAADWQLKSTAGSSEADQRRIRAGYLGAVAYVDHLVGIVLESLLDTDQFDNTLFIFTSDHGEMLGDHGMIYKGSAFFEELVKVPLLISSPGGREGGSVSDALVSHLDLLPTVLHGCGLEVPPSLPGMDLSPAMDGGNGSGHDGLALEYYAANWGERPVPLRGWVTDRWKYVIELDRPVELYDLKSDPGESINRVNDPDCRKVLEQLQADLESWQQAANDPWPDFPKPETYVDMPPGGPWEELSSLIGH